MRSFLLLTALPAAIAGCAADPDAPVSADPPPVEGMHSRSLNFSYEATIRDIPSGTAALDVWIPIPPSDDEQTISDLRFEGPVAPVLTSENVFKNRMAHFHLAPTAAAAGPFRISFRATRRGVVHRPAPGPEALLSDSERALLAPLLRPDRRGAIDDTVWTIAAEVTTGREGAGNRGRAIYDYVESTMRYDKTGEGWGQGDTRFACSEKRGNCTDFHALFMSVARAAGIPARFEMGFSIPTDRTEGPIAGYHCWMRFHQPGGGWIPVDASEGWKQKERREYFFGALDENRILFTRGRDIVLAPPQKGPPLNYFIHPYVEADGVPHAAVDRSYGFKELPVRAGGGR